MNDDQQSLLPGVDFTRRGFVVIDPQAYPVAQGGFSGKERHDGRGSHLQVEIAPMAAVAGALAERVGRALQQEPLNPEVIVENGGDLYLEVTSPAIVSLFAGKSPLSHRVGLRIEAELSPLGVCTSSGSVGHSLSFGRADAACILAHQASLADAAATALGNLVPDAGAIDAALAWAASVPEILGAVVIVGDKLGAWGRVELVPLAG